MTQKQSNAVNGHIAAIKKCHAELEPHGITLLESFFNYVDVVGLNDSEVEFLMEEMELEVA